MKWRVVTLPRAQADLLEAAEWYDSTSVDLGDEFITAVVAVFDLLAINPLLHSKRDTMRNIRLCHTRRFPYRVVYEVFAEQRLVVVLGVLHDSRSDKVWRERCGTN